MKYAAIVVYASGERTGATITAKNFQEAWQKLSAKLPMEHVQKIEIAEILTPIREIE